MGTGIGIARSQTGDRPPDGALANGELAYSFATNKLWIGQTNAAGDAVTNELIGGKFVIDRIETLESIVQGSEETKGLVVENIVASNTGTFAELVLTSGTLNGIAYRQANGLVGFLTGQAGQFLTFASNGTPTFGSSLAGFEVTEVASFAANVVIGGALIANGDIFANNVYVTSNLSVNGDIFLRGDSIQIGDGGDVITLGATVNSSIVPTTTNTYTLGTETKIWKILNTDRVTLYSEPTANTDATTKLYVDTQLTNARTTANVTLLGQGNVLADGAVTTLNSNTSTYDAIDKLNEAMYNIHKGTYVRSVSFSATPTSGGAGTNVTLTLTTIGTANEYDIDWGDGAWSNGFTGTSPSHNYTTNSGSPFTVAVYARNTNGVGEGSNTSITRSDYITIYTADPVPNFTIYNNAVGTIAVTEANTGQAVYLDNTTTNYANTDITGSFAVNWGDSTESSIPSKVDDGGVQGGLLSKTYTTSSGTGSYTVTLYANSHSTADPAIFPLNATKTLKVFDLAIAAPNDITTKDLSWQTASVGTTPALAAGFTAQATGKVAGDPINTNLVRITGSTTLTSTAMPTYFHTTGSVEGHVNGADENAVTVDEQNVDYYNYNASGSLVSASARIYAPQLFETGTKARINIGSSVLTSVGVGVSKAELVTTEGNSEGLYFVYDDMTNAPTIDMTSATLTESGSPSYVYISGVPYYSSGDSFTASGIVVQNLTGQTYLNSSTPMNVTSTTAEGSGLPVATQTKSYTDTLNAADLTSGVPNANLSSVTLKDIPITVSSADAAGYITLTVNNVNGSDTASLPGGIVQCYTGTPTFNEQAIPVADNLGANYTSDGLRISGFSGATPTFNSSYDYYSSDYWNGAETVAGTDEAIVRYDTLKHYTTDLSTGYVPVGPDLATGRTGTQYFRFAFKRSTTSNVRFRLTGKVSGFYIAAPGTAIDSASSINGWLDASIQYAGSGIPGGNTGNGGNGSDGCAITGNDKIVSGTTYSNQAFDLTLGTESLSNAYNNQMLVTIALNSSDYVTAISVEKVT